MDGKLKIREASHVLNRSERQVYRLLSSIRSQGIEGVIHKNRGNQHARTISKQRESQILEWVTGSYRDINDTHLSELFLKREGVKISRQSLRLILRKNGIKPKRKRKSPRYRSRRPRKEQTGMMLQIDGSHHAWLEDRGPPFTLVGGVDDATGTVWALCEPAETTWAYLHLIKDISLSHGIPLSLYSDRHLIFHSPKEPSILDQLNNHRPLTQFGRAMEELGIELIKAYSAPAKGKIENIWKTFQDRFVVELRLAKVQTFAEAKLFLKSFLKEFNQRFAISPKNRESTFRKRPPLKVLDRILCLKETRIVKKDHTISFEGLVLQIPPHSKWASIAKSPVEVFQLDDGSIEIIYKNMTVARFRAESVTKMIKQKNNMNSQLKPAA